MSLWQPRSPCGTGCLPRAGTTPTVHLGRRLGRLVAVAGAVAAGAGLLPVLPLMKPRRRATVARTWARAVLAALGVRVTARGRLPRRAALLVANHVSWLDTLAVLAHTPARLVAKREVRGWPVIGPLAAAAGTLFIDRSRPRTLPATVARAAVALRSGAVVAVFPEGTTWCGRATGRFRPALFQAALDAGTPVVPVTVRFHLAGFGGTTIAAFLGEDTLWASLRRVVAARGLAVTLVAAPALYPVAGADRAALARTAEAAIAMYRVGVTIHRDIEPEVEPDDCRVQPRPPAALPAQAARRGA